MAWTRMKLKALYLKMEKKLQPETHQNLIEFRL